MIHISTLILFEISCSRSTPYEIFIHFSTPAHREKKRNDILRCMLLLATRRVEHEDDDKLFDGESSLGSPRYKRRCQG